MTGAAAGSEVVVGGELRVAAEVRATACGGASAGTRGATQAAELIKEQFKIY